MHALISLTLTEILVLLCQIGQWTILGKISGGHSELLPIEKALFAADFSLICLLSVLFRAYILAHRENLRAEAGLRHEDHSRELHYISLWSVFVSAVFVSSIWTGVFYTFDANGYGKETSLYAVIFAAALLPTVLNTVTTLKNRKLFGVKDTCFLMAFLVVPTVGEGQYVSAGQVIGSVGTTSLIEASGTPHLHFAVKRDGVSIDPKEFLK